MLGTSHTTVERDLGTFVPDDDLDASQDAASDAASGTNVPDDDVLADDDDPEPVNPVAAKRSVHGGQMEHRPSRRAACATGGQLSNSVCYYVRRNDDPAARLVQRREKNSDLYSFSRRNRRSAARLVQRRIRR